ncbi:hypothetical protein AKJ65_08275 [candidate division MSBL1 archaeon SCGC-AAA259E19]|uniref:MoaB/Mog domain-containing protein n=3 Tax=candidate division MSBL1 TaxID=215777 RepID=A0A133V4B6_9EURY|nr:hypothetical protein AKJ64_04600 [candidate division MSBL1 archaeon SCGC-AAA259E17]KXA91915.1 hypothetical protein AKJ65_08275 [candidate division MSBL1 archaeon SCGC-AAA259E19]KXB01282.1 hypothetical protein AKJ41_02170 [candidate division MSBL1 archaeon SCGC-AAA259O05]
MVEGLEVKTLEEARVEFFKNWKPVLRAEKIPTKKAEGRILGEDVKSDIDLPPFDRSVYDGFAVHARDTFDAREDSPVKLRSVGKVLTGQKPDVEVGSGECVEISTGAPVPEDTDSVVMMEDTSSSGEVVEVRRAVSPGENIERKGSELRRGDEIAGEGMKIDPRTYGSLLACGVTDVEVVTLPRVGVLSSGEELVDTDSELRMGEIYDVNGPTISQAAEKCGVKSSYLGIISDDYSSIERRITEFLNEFDAIITSGGTSAGPSDLIPQVVDNLGEPGVVVHGLAQKPGKPTFLAVVDDKPIFGLPGYPVSAYMVFDQLVAPYLREMTARSMPDREEIKAKLTRKMPSARGRRELVPVSLREEDGENLAIPLRKGSGAVTSLSKADGYFEVPIRKELVKENEDVPVRLFGV